MAEDMGDKTEAPTPKRRAEAREQGNVARSADLTAAALLVGTMLMINYYGGGVVAALKTLLLELLGPSSLRDFSGIRLFDVMFSSIWTVGRAVLPLFLGVVFIAVMANVLQVGLGFNTKRITPNVAALNPFKGIGKLFGKGKGTVQFLMMIAKVALVGMVGYSAIHGKLGLIVGVQHLEFGQIFGLATGLIYSISIRLGTLLLVLALLDYAWQKFKLERDLKMTKTEVKEEMRRMDGDPKVKQRRREIQMQQATNRMKQAVPKADVVVTNPTEFAVAIQYDAANMHAPRVVAKGQGFMAAKIREIAIANGVPILERKPLARALYKMVEVGQEIPEEFYATVAEILAYVYELSGKIKRRMSA